MCPKYTHVKNSLRKPARKTAVMRETEFSEGQTCSMFPEHQRWRPLRNVFSVLCLIQITRVFETKERENLLIFKPERYLKLFGRLE